jgi:hypothetical protein
MVNNYVEVLALSLFIFLLNCSCGRKVHNAETRSIPKVMVLTTNINDVAPEFTMSIRTLFKSIPADWYCKHYGSGDGTKPWEIEDSIRISNKNGPIFIPLIFNRATFCPYVVAGIFIDAGIKKGQDDSWETIKHIWFWSVNVVDSFPTPASRDTIIINYKYSDSGLKFVGDEIVDLGIPENVGDTLYFFVLLRNDEGKRANQ